MFERYTERARQVVVLGQDEARALKHSYIGTEHLLLGLLQEQHGLASRVLGDLGVGIDSVRASVRRIVGEGEGPQPVGRVPFTPRAKKVLEMALREALSLRHNYIGTEHILLGLVREDEGVAARILLDLDANAEKIRSEVCRQLRDGRRAPTHGLWGRDDIVLKELWTKGDTIYRVVAIADKPTVVIEDVQTMERQQHVIESPLFAEFDRLCRERPGARDD